MVSQSPDVLEREQRLDEVLACYLKAVQDGQASGRQELLDSHPDLADDLAAFFANQDRFSRLAEPLRAAGTVVSPPARGQTVGDYELLEELARGGMGVVFKARQRSLPRVVALKMLRGGPLATAADRQRFRAEAEAVACLDHPHLVPVYEVGEHEGRLYFTMKLLEGGSLARRVAEFQLPAVDPRTGRDAAGKAWGRAEWEERKRKVVKLLETVAAAVHFAHAHGVLHRDLKPANILLDADGRPHVSDFGLAKRLDAGAGPTQSGTVLGTPSYMAPEQAAGGGGALTTAADVYGLGAILYELLTGRPPFRGDTVLETLRRLQDEEPVPPRTLRPGLDRDLETVCLKCLDKDPARRYDSALALGEDLRRYLRGEPVRARPVRGGERLWRWCRRRPRAAALTAALLASLVGGVGLVAWQWQRAEDNAAEYERQRDEADRLGLEAQRHLEEAERQRAREKESFDLAHQAVNELCVRLGENRLNNVPGLQPLRKELLQAGLKYYQNFLRQRGDDPGLRAELALAHTRVAALTAVVGSKTEALAAYRRALALYQELHAARPDDVGLKAALARVYNRMGILQGETRGHPEETYRRSLALLEALAVAHPDRTEFRADLAAVYTNLGNTYRGMGRPDEALALYRRQLEISEELARARPGDPAVLHSLSVGYRNLGALQSTLGQAAEALKSVEKARDLLEKLARDNPRVLSHQRDLAQGYAQLSARLRDTGRRAEADEFLEKSHALLEKLARDNPGVLQLQADLANTHRSFGLRQYGDGHLAQALDSHQKARAIRAKLAALDPEATDYQMGLAETYADMAAVLARNRQHQDALTCFERALEIRRRLVQGHPDFLEARSDLGLTLNNLGLTLWNLGKRGEAIAAVREALGPNRLAHARAPQIPRYRQRLSQNIADLANLERMAGHLAESAAVALERRRLWPADAAELYQAARELARASAAAAPGKAEPSETERAERDKYAGLAVEALRQALRSGFKDMERLQKDPDLQRLRGRADFQDALAGSGQ
jgi:serine/threonine protein kinase/tetratricopeptide (TPR) repeat protein